MWVKIDTDHKLILMLHNIFHKFHNLNQIRYFCRMKRLICILIFFSLRLAGSAQQMTAEASYGSAFNNENNDNLQELLKYLSIDPNNENYILYCAGHHGHIWSMITSDSIGWHISNGTTRKGYGQQSNIPMDTLSFIKDNIKTIKWGFDSLPIEVKLLESSVDDTYSPFYYEIFVVRDNNIVFYHFNNEEYIGPKIENFNFELRRLMYLMFWLASPSIRQEIPIPNDSSPKK